MPIVAYFSYAIGSYDTRPWWEAISGAITAVAALCLFMAAVSRPSADEKTSLMSALKAV